MRIILTNKIPFFVSFAIFFCLLINSSIAQPHTEDTTYIKVHFLYGSRPLSKYRHTERKWFGGVLGGHVGIENDSNHILNFRTSGNFHVFTSNKKRHSRPGQQSRATSNIHHCDDVPRSLWSNTITDFVQYLFNPGFWLDSNLVFWFI